MDTAQQQAADPAKFVDPNTTGTNTAKKDELRMIDF
jgi:hypothetical protein